MGRGPEKWALVVGINAYGGDGSSDLRGCLDDAQRTAEELETAGWPHDNVRMVTDGRAGRAAIMERLRWLVGESEPGDHLAFAFSGHGTRFRPRRPDGTLMGEMHEALCCAGIADDWDGSVLLDVDMVAEFSKLPHGARLTVILDSCHSGGMSRGALHSPNPGHWRKARSLRPPQEIEWRGARTTGASRGFLSWLAGTPAERPDDGSLIVVPELRWTMLSACRADQTATDALLDGHYCGAFTHARLAARAEPGGAKASTEAILRSAAERLAAGEFEQVPVASGARDLLLSEFLS